MDDLESRLSDELSAAGGGITAGDGLAGAVRTKLRRRQSMAAIAAAMPVLLLVVGAIWMINLGDDEGAVDLDTVVDPDPTVVDIAPPPADPLREALVVLGADVEGAPPGAAALGEAEWCGVDEVSPASGELDDLAPSTCMINATGDGRDAVMVRVTTTIEGDPIVTIAWTRSALWEAPVYVDSSQDAFGAPGWTEMRCELTVDENADAWLTYRNCVPPGSEPLRDALEELGVLVGSAPAGVAHIGEARWCGIDRVFDEPNQDARDCLWHAWQTNEQAVTVLALSTIEGDPIVEVHRTEPAGYIVRWVDATRDRFGSGDWEGPWYCDKFDMVDGVPVGANDCDSEPMVEDTVDEASTDDGSAPPYGAGVEVGRTYDYTLYTHCGIEWAQIDGVWWRTSTRLDDGNANPPPGWGNPFDSGVVEIITGATAIYRGGPGVEVELTRTDGVEPPLDCD